jgi:hypothetical protein
MKEKIIDFIDSLNLDKESFDTQVKILSDSIREKCGSKLKTIKSSSIYIAIEIPIFISIGLKESTKKFVCFERELYPEKGYSISIRFSTNKSSLAIASHKRMLKGSDSPNSLLKLFIEECQKIIQEEIRFKEEPISETNQKILSDLENYFDLS